MARTQQQIQHALLLVGDINTHFRDWHLACYHVVKLPSGEWHQIPLMTVNTGPGNGLVPSGNITKFPDATMRDQARPVKISIASGYWNNHTQPNEIRTTCASWTFVAIFCNAWTNDIGIPSRCAVFFMYTIDTNSDVRPSVRRQPNIGTTVPTLGQRWDNPTCCLGPPWNFSAIFNVSIRYFPKLSCKNVHFFGRMYFAFNFTLCYKKRHAILTIMPRSRMVFCWSLIYIYSKSLSCQ